MNTKDDAPRHLEAFERHAEGCEKPRDHTLQIRIQSGKLAGQFMLIFAEDGAEGVVQAFFDEFRGARLLRIKLLPLHLDFRAQASEFMRNIVDRTGLVIDAPELRFEVEADSGDERLREIVRWHMQDRVRAVEDLAE